MMHIVHMLPPYAQVKCNSLLLKYHNIESIFVKNCLCCMWIQSSGHTLTYRVQRPPSSNIQVHSVNLISQRMSDMVFFMMLSGFAHREASYNYWLTYRELNFVRVKAWQTTWQLKLNMFFLSCCWTQMGTFTVLIQYIMLLNTNGYIYWAYTI